MTKLYKYFFVKVICAFEGTGKQPVSSFRWEDLFETLQLCQRLKKVTFIFQTVTLKDLKNFQKA